jgi:hypothetical protein
VTGVSAAELQARETATVTLLPRRSIIGAISRVPRWVVVVVVCGVLFALYTAVAAVFYWTMRHAGFSLDDPSLIVGLADPSTPVSGKTIANIFANRWRPVANTAYFLAWITFGKHFIGWWAISVVLLGVLGTGSSVVAYWLGRRWWLSIGVGLLVVTSRLSQYQVTQATGLMESVGYVLVVALIACAIGYLKYRGTGWFVATFVVFLALVLTHERYQGLLLPLLVVVVADSTRSRLSRLYRSLLFVLPVAFLSAVKIAVFHLPLAVGSGSSTELGFSWPTLWQNLVTVGGDVFGINIGPAYLAGFSFAVQPVEVQGISLLVGLLTSLLLVAPVTQFLGSARASETRRIFLRNLAIGLALIAGLTLPVIVTSRIEQRYVVTVQIVFLLGICALARRDPSTPPSGNRFNSGLLVLFLVLSFGMNILYRQNMNLVFFRSAQMIEQQQLGVILPLYEESERLHKPIYLVSTGPDPDWNNYFKNLAEANSDVAPGTILVVATSADIPASQPGAAEMSFRPDGGLQRDR